MADETDWLHKAQRWLNEPALEDALATAELDAIIARSGANVAYLSGMRIPGTLGRHQDFVSSARPILVVWPRDADPTIIPSNLGQDLAEASSWIDDVRPYTEYVESAWDHCVERLEELGIDDGRIGVERPELNVDQWTHLEEALPEATLVDCSAELTAVRNVKTDREIEILRESVEIQDAAHLEVFETAKPGDTEKELHARLIESMIRRGAEWAHGLLQSDRTDVRYGGEGPTPIDKGTAFRTDYVSYYRGYAANLSRMAVAGQPTEEQRECYADVREIHRTLIDEKLRPGVPVESIWEFVRDEIQARGYSSVSGLAGHSTGAWWHQEEPIFRPGIDAELRSGMVVCLEPIVDGFWHLQDQLLITDDGAELLSDTFDTAELYQI
ncbi:MAG: M24 family metallopeptidase [Salinirussus sp.]